MKGAVTWGLFSNEMNSDPGQGTRKGKVSQVKKTMKGTVDQANHQMRNVFLNLTAIFFGPGFESGL